MGQTAIKLVFVIKVSLYRVTRIPGNACAKMDGLALSVVVERKQNVTKTRSVRVVIVSVTTVF